MALAFTLGLALLAGCAGPTSSAPPTASTPAGAAVAPASTTAPAAQPAAAGALATVRYNQIQAQPWYWDAYIAEDLGLWTQLGLTVEKSVLDTNGSDAMRALLGGQFDVQSNAFDVWVTTASTGADTSMLSFEMTKPEHSLYAQKTIKTIQELKGKKIGFPNLQSGTALIVRSIFRKAGLKDTDYEAVVTGPAAPTFQAFTTGVLDGVSMVVPWKIMLQRQGYTFLGDASDSWDLPFLTLGGRKSWIEQHPKETTAFLRGMVKARDWLYAPANKDQAIDILAKHLSIEKDIATEVYNDFIPKQRIATTSSATINDDQVKRMGAAMVELGIVKESDVKVQGSYTMQYLQDAQKAEGH